MMHTGLGRAHPLHIEYIHISATLAVIQDVLSEAILSHPRLALARKIAVVKALGKVIWIQNDLFAKWYVVDGEEFTDGVDYAAALLDREGYLRGKRVLVREEEGCVDGSGGSSACPVGGEGKQGDGVAPGVCPFTRVVAEAEAEGLREKGMSGVEEVVPPKNVEVVVDGE